MSETKQKILTIEQSKNMNFHCILLNYTFIVHIITNIISQLILFLCAVYSVRCWGELETEKLFNQSTWTKKFKSSSWGHCSVVKWTYCSYRGLEFSSQHPYQRAHSPGYNSSPKGTKLSSGLLGTWQCTHTCKHACIIND